MIWIQVVGLVALLLDASSVQFRHRRHILFVQILASLTWTAHFLLLGAVAGGMMNLVGVVRSIGFYIFPDRRRSLWVLWFVIGLSVVTTIALWRGLESLLPMTAMILAVFAFWQRDEQRIRILLLTAVPLWFIYNLVFISYAGMLSDVLALVSLLVALYRHRSVPSHEPVTVRVP